jgi:hypothetical protein
MFELGYAIGRNKHVWLVQDRTLTTSLEGFKKLRVLSTIGYCEYEGVHEIVAAYLRERPHERTDGTLLEGLLPSIAAATPSLLYLKSMHDTTPSIRISERVGEAPLAVIVDDPRESPYQTLAWYAENSYRSEAVICHFTDPQRKDADLRNARCALVAGMAAGMGKNVLMLCEGDFLAPLDYRDLLYQYSTARAAERHLDSWLAPREEQWRERSHEIAQHQSHLQLQAELKGLKLGDHLAENEAEALVDGYFTDTNAYRQAREGVQTVFVGRKGAGKSANFLQLSADLRADRRNVVAIVKPVAYDLHGLIALLGRFREKAAKGFALESIWKFLLYSEIGHAIANGLRELDQAAHLDSEVRFLKFYENNCGILEGDFSLRLERCVTGLEFHNAESQGKLEEQQRSISELLHMDVLPELRDLLVDAMLSRSRERVAILVDNLDKSWDLDSDLTLTSEFLLGLLTATNRVRTEISRKSDSAIRFTAAVFLRTDIFDRVKAAAREPDKLGITRMTWDEPALLNLIQTRYLSSHPNSVPTDLWSRFFCDRVDGLSTQEFLVNSVLPRPRDLIYLVNAAIAAAVNRGHGKVEPEDIKSGLAEYSEFVFESFLIENPLSELPLENILFEFIGCPKFMRYEFVEGILAKAGVKPKRVPEVIDFLRRYSFLGIEARPGDFRYADRPSDVLRLERLARATSPDGSVRYTIHPAFVSFLGVTS